MKAILVIDVPTLDDGRHLCNECPIWNNERLFCQYVFNMKTKGCPLKPMPKEEDIYEVGMDEEDTRAKQQWNKGWNACLDEITGETE